MRPRTHRTTPAIAALVAVVVLGAHAEAATREQACQSTIIKESGKFVATKVKLLQKCEEAIVRGRPGYSSPPGMQCNDSMGKTGSLIEKAALKLRLRVDAACGGADNDCGTGDDLPLATIGWDIGQCPDLEGHGCTNAITHCGGITSDGQGITDCLLCIDHAAVDQAMNLYYDDLDPTEFGSSSPDNKCQAAIGKETAKFLLAKSQALAKCQDAVNNGLPGFTAPCPAGDSSGGTAAAIANAESKKVAKLCQACGGADRFCGDGDDPNPQTDIGFADDCPAVHVPGGQDCGAIGALSTVPKLVDCVDCVTEFKVDCIQAAAAPNQGSYPAQCGGGATATPTVTPTPTGATPTQTGTPGPTQTPCPTATGACPTQVVFEASGVNANLDTGWTGIAHDSNTPTMGRLTLTLSGCASGAHPCGQCNVSGPVTNAGGAAFNNQRCADRPWIQCTSNVDCTVAGGQGPCAFFFGAPLPLSSGGVPVCVLNQVVGTVTGTVNVEAGSSLTRISLLSRIHPNGAVNRPCPICVSGTCDSGPRMGQACTVNGVSNVFGPTSLDCPPDPAGNAGNLNITLPTSTGTQTMTLNAASPNCRAAGFAGVKCLCDVCNNANAQACTSNADCPDNPSGTPGICGGTRCLGGVDDGKPCTSAADCTPVPPDTEGSCDVPGGTPTQPNACSNNICVANPNDTQSSNEGHCQNGPNDTLCSIERFRTCTSTAGCNPPPNGTCNDCVPGQVCTVKRRECFTDNGQIGGSVSVAGQADVPCGSNTSHPKLGSLFCIPPSASSSVNTTAGLPGLGRLTLPGTATLN